MINKYNSDTKKSEKKARKPRKTSLWNRIMKSPEPQKTERAVPVASIDLMTLTSDKQQTQRRNKFMDTARNYFRKGNSKSPHILTPNFRKKKDVSPSQLTNEYGLAHATPVQKKSDCSLTSKQQMRECNPSPQYSVFSPHSQTPIALRCQNQSKHAKNISTDYSTAADSTERGVDAIGKWRKKYQKNANIAQNANGTAAAPAASHAENELVSQSSKSSHSNIIPISLTNNSFATPQTKRKSNEASLMSLAFTSSSASQLQKQPASPRFAVLNKSIDDFTGRCSMMLENGQHYRGRIENGKRHGFGQCQFDDGSWYVGEWSHDVLHGHGQIIWSSGQKYIGNLHLNHLEGYGCYTYSTGATYKGQFKMDKKHGRGTYTWACGQTLEGMWLYDKPDGTCKLTWPENNGNAPFSKVGIWNQGQLIRWLPQEEDPMTSNNSESGTLRTPGSLTKRDIEINFKIHNSLKSLDSMEKRLDKDMRDLQLKMKQFAEKNNLVDDVSPIRMVPVLPSQAQQQQMSHIRKPPKYGEKQKKSGASGKKVSR